MRKGRVIIIYERDNEFNSEGRLTGPMLIICIAVASAGLMYGYDIGINGGITKAESFLKKFFPSVLRSQKNAKVVDGFCLFYSWKLTAYNSSLYIAGIFSALMAGRLTTSAGRKGALIIGGIIYLIGTAPIYLVEMAPTKWRGAIGIGFQIFFWSGVAGASWINYFIMSSLNSKRWRIAVSVSGFPATIMTIIAFFIPDTPSSLIQRGKVQQALKSLNQVRGTKFDSENELKYLIKYNEDMRIASETPYKMLLERKYRPHLLFAIALPTFQALTGFNLNAVVGQLIVTSLGIRLKDVFPILLIQSTIFFVCLLLTGYLIDRVGRRIMLIVGGCQIFICQVILAILMASESRSHGTSIFSKRSAFVALILRCFLGVGMALSWGPLPWILNCEILPIEVRSAGQGLSTAISFAVNFITIQTVYPMLCHFKYGAYLFYAGWTLIMTIFVVWFLPETKRIPLESMDIIWHGHWYWHRFFDQTMLKSKLVELSESESVEPSESVRSSESIHLKS
ncbi:sugar transport protein 5 isoform X2 [Citrus clementina]|uniref:sugar transport protein 5 isoform X2 n=1 Tax=Citrus clementina TaxID=85681 RepID=UPI000CECF9BB|nr:sugar transport protein 5 isoform X2 [Citrus x clementina]